MSNFLSHRRKSFRGGGTLPTFANSSRSFRGDSSKDSIHVPHDPLLTFGDGTNDSPFSLSAWVKMDVTTRFRICAKSRYDNTLQDSEYIFSTDGNSQLLLLVFDASEGFNNSLSGVKSNFSQSSRQGLWTHYTATYDGRGGVDCWQGMNLYINGLAMSTSKRGTSTVYNSMESTASDFTIGITNYAQSTLYYSDGSISDVRVYDRELSASDADDLSNKIDVQSGLVLHSCTDVDSPEDQSSNSLGGEHKVAVRTSTLVPPLPNNPVFGNRYYLADSDNAEIITVVQDSAMESIFQDSHTFAFWVKFLDGQPSSTQMIFGAQSQAGSNIARVTSFISNTGHIYIGYIENGNQGRAKTTTAQASGLTDWVHVVGITTPSGMSVYLDGVQETLDATDNGDMSGVNMSNYSNSTDIMIGSRCNFGVSDLLLDGRICDLRIYSKALSQSEINNLVSGTHVSDSLEHWYLTNDDDRLDKAGNNDGYDASVYRADSP